MPFELDENNGRNRFANDRWVNSLAHDFQERAGVDYAPTPTVGGTEEWKPYDAWQIEGILRQEAQRRTRDTGQRHDVVGRNVVPVGPPPEKPLSEVGRAAADPGDGSRWDDIGI